MRETRNEIPGGTSLERADSRSALMKFVDRSVAPSMMRGYLFNRILKPKLVLVIYYRGRRSTCEDKTADVDDVSRYTEFNREILN